MLQLTSGAEPVIANNSRRHQATVEDYFSDDGQGNGVQIDAFTSEHSPSRANVRTKRSNPEDMGTDRTPTDRVPNNIDGKSDSGYSSQSVAGMSSADSAASATSQRSPPAITVNPIPAAASSSQAQKTARPPHRRQPSSQSAQGSQSAPRQPLSRRESQTSRGPPPLERRPTITQSVPKRRDSRNDECTKPGCAECGPNAIESRSLSSRRKSILRTQPTESAPDVSHPHSYDTRSLVSDSAQYAHSSSRDSRPRRMYHAQGGPLVQPAASRRLSVNARQTRPSSYHGDPNYNWPQQGMHPSHPSPPHEYGPPLSRSAYENMPYGQPHANSPFMQQYPPQGPPPPAFFQAQQMQPMYNPPRPPLQARALQPPGYGHPMLPGVQVARSDRNMPSPRYHPNAAPPQMRRPPPAEYCNEQEYDDSESESESESESDGEEYEPSYRPQARITAQESRAQRGVSKQQRPSLRHARTTPAPPTIEPKRPQTVVVPDQRDRRARDRNQEPRQDRRNSMSRPPLVPSIKSQSAYDTPQARILVEGSRSSRRGSSQAYDGVFHDRHGRRPVEYIEQRRSNRASSIYDDVLVGHDYEQNYYEDEDDAEPVARAPLRRRGVDTESRRRPQRPVEVKQTAEAEDYIMTRRGDRETYADQTYEIAKNRSLRTSGGPSEAESSRSRGSENNGEIRLRIGNDAPVTLSLNGDIEGRILQLVPIENGMNELVISSNFRGGESTYRSEGGSIRGERKAITSASQARRDAEEMTERSSQSIRRRRGTRGEQDEPRRALRRQMRREERGEPEYRH